MRLVCVLCLATLVSGCDGLLLVPTQPTAQSSLPTPVPSPTTPQVFEAIAAGQKFDGRLTRNGDSKAFLFVAPTDGVLIARVSWDRKSGSLELWSGDRAFVGDGVIVARIAVVAGQRCVFSVDDGAPWDYGGLDLPYALNVEFDSDPAFHQKDATLPLSRHVPDGRVPARVSRSSPSA